MCTVTYIPDRKGFYLTSNRDEQQRRGAAIPPREFKEEGYTLLYPQDADQHGSWIAAKNTGDVAVLLNGAFKKHNDQPIYRKSRGLILRDIISYEYPYVYFKDMYLEGIAPFTLVLCTDGKLYECRWDGTKKYTALMDKNNPHIWSSATLYEGEATAKRKQWFTVWDQENPVKTSKRILNFHRTAGNGDLHDGLVMNREEQIKTVSITHIRVNSTAIKMTYQDLKTGREYVNKVLLTTNYPVTFPVKQYPFLTVRKFFIKLFNWEYWPFNAVYAPIMFYWFWLSLKSRSFFFFSTANPSIENGGFALESKAAIYDLIPKKYSPRTLLFKTGTALSLIKEQITVHQFSFPMIAKPDIGGRGVQVKLVHNERELADYIKQIRVDFLLQAYVDYKNEVGLFYYRIPGEMKGHISGIVGKEFLTVTGDGRSTIKELLIREPRHLLQLDVLTSTYGLKYLEHILSEGESQTMVPYGNHARGAKFIDLSYLITDELTQHIDRVCRQIPGFYFGRMDIMYHNWEEFCAGKNFSIIELNGAGSEPTHIYDPSHSIFFAWKEIIRHWKLLYRISKLNNEHKGLKYMSYEEGTTMLRDNNRYLKLVS